MAYLRSVFHRGRHRGIYQYAHWGHVACFATFCTTTASVVLHVHHGLVPA